MEAKRYSLRIGFLVTVAAMAAISWGQGVQFPAAGVRLPGPQLKWDGYLDLVDWNGNGRHDLLMTDGAMNNYFVHLNEGTWHSPVFNTAIRQPHNFTEIRPFGAGGYYFDTVEHGQAVAYGDLTGDGLLDIVTYDGRLKMVLNRGKPFSPYHWEFADYASRFPGSEAMQAANTRYATGPESMMWNKGIFPRQVLTLSLVDWNGNGLLDLLVCRFKGQAPGVVGLGLNEHWTPFGRGTTTFGPPPVPVPTGPTYHTPLAAAPERETFVYLNAGTASAPWFDAGVEIKIGDRPVAAPNPIAMDVDGDGVPDLVASEVPYRSNAFRVDWPTVPSVVWWRRPGLGQPGTVDAAQPLLDSRNSPIPAGTQVRAVDVRGAGVKDLFVLDVGGSLRWYRNNAGPGKPAAFAAATVLRGGDFAHLTGRMQPVVVNWFGAGSRDLLMHGVRDRHCKWGLRRTALYRNVATVAGEVAYEFAGWLSFNGDLAMVPQTLEYEATPAEVFGSAISMMPEDGSGQKRLVMSVNGRLYLFAGLAADGLTFTRRTPLNLPAERNHMRGWQTIALGGQPVKHIRIQPTNNQELLRDDRVHLVRFEAWEGGVNRATPTTAAVTGPGVVNPGAMLQPGDWPGDTPPAKMTTVGGGESHLIVTLDQERPLTSLRFLLSPRDRQWYEAGSPSSVHWPFYWQNELHRQSHETGDPWYQYLVEVSADGTDWVVVDDRRVAEMHRSHPVLVDWDGDGKVDLMLGVLHHRWYPPWGVHFHQAEYRLYRNLGSNASPVYSTWEPVKAGGQPLVFTFSHQVSRWGIEMADLDGDGKPDLIVQDQGPENRLRFYRNVSTQQGGLDFEWNGYLGTGGPLQMRGVTQTPLFEIADVDGDGVLDLLYSDNQHPLFFKGTRTTAPAVVTDLTRLDGQGADLVVRWTRPPGTSAYALRWRTDGPLTDANWVTSTVLESDYTADVGGLQQATVPTPPADTRVYLAVKSRNAAGDWSPLSRSLHTATGSRSRLVLRNGGAGADGVVAYSGADAVWLDGAQPTSVMGKDTLKVRSRPLASDTPRVLLARFASLPPLAQPLARATLELTTTVSDDLIGPPSLFHVSCYGFRHDWNPASATFANRAAGTPWTTGELLEGGDFASHQAMFQTVGRQQTVTWDVTAALQQAIDQNQTTLGLLLRVDYAGDYGADRGFQLLGTTQGDIEARPRLVIETNTGMTHR